MNEPAYRFYLERNPGVDLETDLLEVDVCAQHNNGGLVVDAWWESNVAGFFPVGEAGGAHGVYRPGGAALNSGQVGATRAAQRIAAREAGGACVPAGGAVADDARFAAAATPVLAAALDLTARATARAAAGAPDSTGALLRDVQRLMSEKAGPVRSAASVQAALDQVHAWLGSYQDVVSADGTSRRSVDRVFLVRDVLTSAYVYLSAMADYLGRGGRSRGSVLCTDADGDLPRVGHGADAATELDLPELYRFRLDGGALDARVQETAWVAPGGAPPVDGDGDGWAPVVARAADDPAGVPVFRWRARRPIPQDDDFFENVWRDFREHGNVV